MTAPGSSEGISWIDVAASAAGLTQQMESLGQQARSGFVKSFNANLSADMQNAIRQAGPGVAAAGREHGQVFGQAFGSTLQSSVSQHVTTHMQTAGKQGAAEAGKAGQAMGGALSEGMADGLLKAGAGAAVAGIVIKDIRDLTGAVKHEFEAFGKLGHDAADAMMSDFSAVMAGKMPDIKATFGLLEEGFRTSIELPLQAVQVGIDATLGMVPLLGKTFSEAFHVMDDATVGMLDDLTAFGGEFTEIMLDVGDKWQDAARKIAGQTLDESQLTEYMGILKDLAGSGTLANFNNAADAVGLLGQRLSTLGQGVGLTREQLTELTKTLALSDELLGLKINVDDLTAAFNQFDIAPEHTAEELTFLTNVARMTGDNINSLIKNVDQLGPTFGVLGYSMDQTAFFAGRMNQELGPVQATRMVATFTTVNAKLRESGLTMTDLIDLVKAYHRAGNDAAAQDFLKGLGASGRNLSAIIKLINEDILTTPEAMQQAMDATGDKLRKPLDDAVDATKGLQESLDEISNQMQSAFADVGLPLVKGLDSAADDLKLWLSENKDRVIGWGADIMSTIGRATSSVLIDMGKLLVDMAPFINDFKNFVLANFVILDKAMQAILAPLSLLPSWAGGDVFKDALRDARSVIPELQTAIGTDLAPTLAAAGQGMENLGSKIRQQIPRFDEYAAHARELARVNEALSNLYPAKPGDKPAFQSAIGSDDQGLKLLPGSDWTAIAQQMDRLGFDVNFDQQTGRIKSFVADTQAEADALAEYLKSKFGDKLWDQLKPQVPITVTPQPVPAPAPAPPGPPPAAALPPPGAGAPPPAAGQGPQPVSPVLPPNLQAPVPHARGSGYTIPSDTSGLVIAVPTTLTARNPADRQTAEQLMDALGVPTQMQGPDGVTLPVKFDVSNMPPMTMPAGFDLGNSLPGPGGSPTMPGGPRFQNVDWQGVARYESGGDWRIDHGEGTPDNPVTGGLQIGDKTWADFGGQQYAPRAFMATPEQQIQIAEKVLAAQGPGAWPVTSRQHPELFGGGGGAVPAGAGGSGSANAYAANPGADDDQGVTPEIRAVEQIAHQFHLRLTAGRSGHGTHDRDGGYHDSGEAGDFSDGYQTPNELAFAQFMEANFGPALAEVIHTDPALGQLVKDGRLVNPSFYGADTLAGHHDHVHIAVRPGMFGDLAGAGFDMPTPGASGVQLAGFNTGDYSGGGNVFGADYGDPRVPAPNQPGGSYGSVPPPPGMTPVPEGTPGAVKTPYGTFQYPWDMPPEQQQLLTPEQRQKFAEWLHGLETEAERHSHAQQSIDDANDRLNQLLRKKQEADDALNALDNGMAGLTPQQQEERRKAPDYVKAQEKAAAADDAYARAQQSLAEAKTRQHDDEVQDHIAAEKPPPWESTKGGEGDKDAQSLGKGLVKGVFQELGFPDVFGKAFTQWQLPKLAMGVGGFGLELLQQKMGGGGMFGAATGSTGSAPSGGGGGGGALANVAFGFLQNLLPHAGASGTGSSGGGGYTIPASGGGWTPGGAYQPGGAPPPAGSVTPAAARSEAPSAAQPLGAMAGGAGASLTVNNTYQGFNPTPQVKDQIQSISHTTSAPTMGGGAGLPV